MASKVNPMKSPLKMTEQLENDHILGQPNDLLKLIYIINELGVEWPQEDNNFRRLVVNKIREVFDDSGEESTELCFDIAINYGFIESQKDNKSGQMRYVCKRPKDLSHDWFCFDCDVLVNQKSRQFVKCNHCLKVFHRKCVNQYLILEDYECPYCKRVNEWETDGMIGMNGQQSVDQKRINVLINYLMIFIKKQMKDKYEKFTLVLDPNKELIVYQKMDLSLMAEKIRKSEYKSVSKFEDDFFVFMHNLHITSFDFSTIADSFADLRVFLQKELKELRVCVDCYEMSNDKELQDSNKDWFCEPCHPPHDVAFVKVKGHPTYPAKVIFIHDDHKKVRVKFFDNKYQIMDVKKSDIYDINDQILRNALNNNTKLIKPKEMLEKYFDLLKKEGLEITGQQWVSHTTGQQSVSKELSVNEMSSIDDSIETVVQKAHKGRGRKKKCETMTVTSSSTQPLVISTAFKPSPMESNPSIGAISADVSNISLDESLPTLSTVKDIDSELKDKRRSGRISAQNKSAEKKSQTKAKNKSKPKPLPVLSDTDDSQPMDVENRQMNERNDWIENLSSVEIIEQSEDSQENQSSVTMDVSNEFDPQLSFTSSINTKTSTKSSKPKENVTKNKMNSKTTSDINPEISGQTNTETIDEINSGTKETTEQTQTTIGININTETKVHSNTETRVETNIATGSHINTQTVSSQPNTTETTADINTETETQDNVLMESFDFEENLNQMTAKMNELLAIKEETIKTTQMKDKIIVMKYYFNQLMDNYIQLRQQLIETKRELKDCKTKNWCAVCQNPATLYCCLRVYCSAICQTIDWRRGHSTACLTLRDISKPVFRRD